jgi:hypothetical protein
MSKVNHETIVENFNSTVNKQTKFCYLVRDESFQRSAVEELENFRGELRVVKKRAQESRLEETANLLLALEFLAGALIEELLMWISLKANRPDDAWRHLVEAQSYAGQATGVHAIAEGHGWYIERLEVVERIIFPPQLFGSVGVVVEKSECSICGAAYGACDHFKGKAYNGELCARIIKKCKLSEISFVIDPANKHCRALCLRAWNELTVIACRHCP